MQRPIKFRAWNSVAGKMYYEGDETTITPGHSDEFAGVLKGKAAITYEYDFNGDTYDPTYEITDLPVMQYTGIKDKNGKEIYEWDVVVYGDQDQQPLTVSWSQKGGFVTASNAPDAHMEVLMMGGRDITQCKVVGNIYENPELLGVKPLTKEGQQQCND